MQDFENDKSSLLPWLTAAIVIPLAIGGWLIVNHLKTRPTLENIPSGGQGVDAVERDPREVAVASANNDHSFADKVHPFLTTYCLTCHNDEKQAGGMSLQKFKDQATAMNDRKIWNAAAEVVRQGNAPEGQSATD